MWESRTKQLENVGLQQQRPTLRHLNTAQAMFLDLFVVTAHALAKRYSRREGISFWAIEDCVAPLDKIQSVRDIGKPESNWPVIALVAESNILQLRRNLVFFVVFLCLLCRATACVAACRLVQRVNSLAPTHWQWAKSSFPTLQCCRASRRTQAATPAKETGSPSPTHPAHICP